ncbi:hypothetical protein [Paenimyroides aestuarii]|uniref:Uncharacterized protein n=1 Tax=Paenimyroides aestuarii TaxID=2968490 RepID=A0ABY5NV30_9FLAO|nr:hypothetical protein [Paenimyroides aestuarii]UUV22309.1 hypothetical protein NPX36_04540 [Paenimyroides aestuarii]
MRKVTKILITISIVISLISCEKALIVGEKLPQSNAAYVWEVHYKNTDLDEKRIALEGYISLENWRGRGDENYCEFVDETGMHLMFLTIQRKSKNSLKIQGIGKNLDSTNKCNIIKKTGGTF